MIKLIIAWCLSGVCLATVALGNPVPVLGEAINFSTRAELGAQPLIQGVVIQGEKVLLIRAVGPGLKAFGVANPVKDPVILLHDSHGNVLQESVRISLLSDDQHQLLAKAVTDAGAFPIEYNSDDAVLIVPVAGVNTLSVKSFSGGKGEVLVESYVLPWSEYDRSSLIVRR